MNRFKIKRSHFHKSLYFTFYFRCPRISAVWTSLIADRSTKRRWTGLLSHHHPAFRRNSVSCLLLDKNRKRKHKSQRIKETVFVLGKRLEDKNKDKVLSHSLGYIIMVKTFQAYLPSCHRTYSCIHCRAHLANHDELISKVRCILIR